MGDLETLKAQHHLDEQTVEEFVQEVKEWADGKKVKHYLTWRNICVVCEVDAACNHFCQENLTIKAHHKLCVRRLRLSQPASRRDLNSCTGKMVC